MSDLIVIQPQVTELTVTEDVNQVVVSSVGVQGPAGATGATGATGASGVIAVTAPITNSGTSTSANIGVSAGSTSAAGVLQLTDSTSSTSTTTAATPNAVKTAYDLADSAVTYSNLAKVSNNSATTLDTISRQLPFSIQGNASGIVVWNFFTPSQTMNVTQISFLTSTTAAASLTLARMGLYSVDSSNNATLVARTANDTTLFTSAATIFTRSFDTTGGYPSSYNLIAGQRYATANIQVGTTVSTFVGLNPVTSGIPILSLSPRIQGQASGQTDLPTSRTTYTNGGAIQWSRLTS